MSVQNLSLAAHWKHRYEQERAKHSQTKNALREVRVRRDYYRRLVEGYETLIGVRKERVKAARTLR